MLIVILSVGVLVILLTWLPSSPRGCFLEACGEHQRLAIKWDLKFQVKLLLKFQLERFEISSTFLFFA